MAEPWWPWLTRHEFSFSWILENRWREQSPGDNQVNGAVIVVVGANGADA